ncbi:Na/Pi cotransporter family protein [Roseburia intestinalis]|jgi:Na/Pi-cotransporter II-like protein|uniref:Na/Pi cotransporter family protein n=3 Tax=Roseburia intestinalis TaxID=166486 RepID=A0A3R6HN19_9FIRM|nr:Na/Pi cotransporter family protein [Roseburia intestinalis]RHA69714.1 Na/Pi cotransporter family protein [Roseburia intestinalis]RHN11880.1 Na/Pi cotransporter family protein [Roseburia intestinalis]CBL11643.1 Na/Pi-cotransporter [Roseburia intestinalis XB6B4]
MWQSGSKAPAGTAEKCRNNEKKRDKMGAKEFASLLGGLALFLYGMNMMSQGMEAAAGNKMKQILERLTTNRYLGVLVGAVITAIIQSSSATTVMVVGFVNSGMMTLRQAVGVIMGANIGTTITGQLIALDAGAIAPFIAFLGVVMVVFLKQPKVRNIGGILAGLGVLFIGMEMMSTAMMPLRDSKAFIDMMTKFSNPLLGILAGAIFTALIQSSSASVGILQALATSGAISFSGAVYVLFGQNIGTCITAVLASIGTGRNAKRTTIIHLSFNIIGTAVFTILCMLTPLTSWVGGFTPANPAAQIANMHTLFNIVTTILLLPAGNLLAKLAEKILPDVDEPEEGMYLKYLKNTKPVTEGKIGVSAINFELTHKEIARMLEIAKKNVSDSFTAFLNCDDGFIPKVEEKEEYVDFLNREISEYISTNMAHESNTRGSRILSAYFKVTSNVERISDHAMNICGYSEWLKEKDVRFSQEVREEILQMQQTCEELLTLLLNENMEALDELSRVSALEQKMDDMTEDYRNRMMHRIQEGTASGEGSVLYTEMLTDFERIGDHALNIAQEMTEVRLAE